MCNYTADAQPEFISTFINVPQGKRYFSVSVDLLTARGETFGGFIHSSDPSFVHKTDKSDNFTFVKCLQTSQ